MCMEIHVHSGKHTIGGQASLEHSTCLVVHLSEGLHQYLEEHAGMIDPSSHMGCQLVSVEMGKERERGV